MEKLIKTLRLLIPLCFIPLTVLLGATVVDERRYGLISLCVAILVVWLFLLGFEKETASSRRTVLVAVLIALSVVGRMIPLFKPITAITVLSAIYLGAESGFTVGALSALISNFYFGQGPWTPFQMLAWGLIGLFAAWLSRPLRKSHTLLLIYGLLSAILYSALMDVWTVLWASQTITSSIYLAALLTALPHTILYAVSNVIFLALLAKPFGEKLERVKIKYGV